MWPLHYSLKHLLVTHTFCVRGRRAFVGTDPTRTMSVSNEFATVYSYVYVPSNTELCELKCFLAKYYMNNKILSSERTFLQDLCVSNAAASYRSSAKVCKVILYSYLFLITTRNGSKCEPMFI